MKQTGIYSVIVLSIFCLSFAACLQGKDEESGKGSIDKITDRAAEKAVKYIKTPLDKARTAQEKENERTSTMEEAVKE